VYWQTYIIIIVYAMTRIVRHCVRSLRKNKILYFPLPVYFHTLKSDCDKYYYQYIILSPLIQSTINCHHFMLTVQCVRLPRSMPAARRWSSTICAPSKWRNHAAERDKRAEKKNLIPAAVCIIFT